MGELTIRSWELKVERFSVKTSTKNNIFTWKVDICPIFSFSIKCFYSLLFLYWIKTSNYMSGKNLEPLNWRKESQGKVHQQKQTEVVILLTQRKERKDTGGKKTGENRY